MFLPVRRRDVKFLSLWFLKVAVLPHLHCCLWANVTCTPCIISKPYSSCNESTLPLTLNWRKREGSWFVTFSLSDLLSLFLYVFIFIYSQWFNHNASERKCRNPIFTSRSPQMREEVGGRKKWDRKKEMRREWKMKRMRSEKERGMA